MLEGHRGRGGEEERKEVEEVSEVNIRGEKANTRLTKLGMGNEELEVGIVRVVGGVGEAEEILGLTQRAQRHGGFFRTQRRAGARWENTERGRSD